MRAVNEERVGFYSETELLPDLPPGWAWAKLEEVARVNPGLESNSGGLPDDLEVSFVPMRAIEEETGRMDASDTRALGQVRKGYTAFQEGDIVFAKITPSMENGKIAVARQLRNGIGFGTTEFHVIRPEDGISAEYLFYFLLRKEYRAQAARRMTGTAGQLRVPAEFLRESYVPIAPANEQRRIVERLEQLLPNLAAGVRYVKEALAKLKRYRQAVLRAAVTGELSREWRETNRCRLKGASDLLEAILEERRRKCGAGEVIGKGARQQEFPAPDMNGLPPLPEGWLWVRLDTLAHVQGGITKNSNRDTHNTRSVPYLGVANVQRGYLDLTKVKTIEATEEEIAALRLQYGDILFTEGGDRDKLGRSCIWQNQLPECIHQNHVFRARLYTRRVLPQIISWCANTYGKDWFLAHGKQTTNLASISLRTLSRFPVVLIAEDEQEVIVREVERRLSMADKVEAALLASLSRADRLRQAILNKAFSGDLVPQNPNEEPAYKLLERIKAQRDKTGTSKGPGHRQNQSNLLEDDRHA